MPERRKMKSPSPQMTSTPKMKRKDREHDSPMDDMKSRLGFKEKSPKKDIPLESMDVLDYNDGTTRPMFKKRLRNVTADVGELAQMECVVSGTPQPKVLWLKNNRPLKDTDGCKVIVDDNKNILVFPSAKDDDVGTYTARAMNVNGSVMSTAEFTITDGKPLPAQSITDSPMDLDFTTPAYFFQMSSCEVTEGRLARFDCRVVAYPKPEIVWMRDGKVMESSERFKLLNFNNEIYSLLIQDVTLADTGRYTCWARNKFGEAMTEAYLNVVALTEEKDEGDMAPKFLTRFYDQQTTEGTAVDFKCLIAGRPEPSVTWLLDDVELTDSPSSRMKYKDGMVSLEIKSPKVKQSGNYTCTIKNTVGEASCNAKLSVVEDHLHGKMLPKFLKKFDHSTAKDGEDVKFTCVVVGEPRPAVTWMFDHKPILDSNRHYVMKSDGDVYTLTIKGARFDDAGPITCKAVNSEGEVYCSANLHVRESMFLSETPEKSGYLADDIDSKYGYIPTFTKRLHDMEVKEGAKTIFDCRIMGIPDPDVTWMKDGRIVGPGSRYQVTRDGDKCRLVIDKATEKDVGVYTCIISNSKGKTSTTAGLKLEAEKPEKPKEDTRVKRYTPEKYGVDDVTSVKRPYKIEAKPARRRSFDSSFSSRFDDSSLTYPKRSYESPRRDFSFDLDSSYQPYDSSKNDYSFDLYSPRKPYERSRSDHSYEIDSPRKSYESPRTGYSFDYQSPRRPYESPKLDTSLDRSRPRRLYTRSRSNDLDLETPRKDYYTRVEPSGPTPVIPYDRPSLMNKREDSVRLSWLPAPTLNLPAEARHISYVVESREVPGKEWVKVASHVPTTTYTVKHLRPDKEYDFRVRAANHHGLSEPTYPASLEKRHDDLRKFTDLPEMRAAPRLPTHRPIITDLGAETVRLAWKPAEQYQAKRIPPVSYRLEAMELPGKDWLPLSSRLRDTSHYLSELPQDRDYMIRVRAENDFGISEPTEPLWLPRARVFPGVPISRPEIVEVEAGKARLSWTRVDIPTFGLDDAPLRYMLEVEEPSKDWRPVARDLDSTEYLIDGLKPDHDYKFRVRAKTLTGVISEPSPAASLYTTLARSRAPVDRLEVLEYEPDTRSVQLSWQRVEIPPYHIGDEPLLYMLEYQEPPLPDWKMLVTGIPTTRYRVMHLDPDREYSFRVRALTSYGVSPPSPALPVSLRNTPVFVHKFVRPLPDPVIISEVEPDSLRLTWRRPMYDLSQPITYQIEMLEPPIHYWKPLATGYTDTTYKVTGLKPTKDYQFRVIPHIQSKSLEPTPIAALTSSPVRPRLPMSEPSLKELTPDSVLLSWRPAELPVFQRIKSPIHYRLEMQEVPSSKWTPVARRITDTSYKVTGLRPNVDYKFRVYGETEFGSSEPSLPTLLHRKPAPKFPTNEPTIRDITPNIVMLSWLPAEVPSTGDPLMYRIEIQTPPGIGSWTTLYAAHPLPSIRLADIRPDLDYLVRVRAVYGDYVSEPTQPVYIPRRACPPRMPVDEPYAVEITSDAVKLQWRNAELPTHITDYAPITYCLEAQELPHGTWMTVSRGIPHTDFKVTALNPQKDYAFRVRAENSYGLSDPTRSVVIKPRSVAPIMPHEQPFLYDVGDGTVRLSWRPATLPSHASSASPITYTIFVQEFPFKTWRPLVRRIPHTSYCIGGLKADADYNFRVQAENEHGSSQPTEPVYLPKLSDIKRPISMPEVSDFDDDFTSMKIHWKPIGPHFEKSPHKYLIETWEPLRREWKPFVRGIADTSYRLKDLPKVPEPIFRVRMETEQAGLSEPSLPVSIGSAYKHPRMPVYRPQLFELDTDTVRLSWQPVYEPEGVLRSRIRYLIEQREIPESRWITVASDLMETSYRVKGLRSKSDYEFRVRAVIDGTTSEPSFPVCLYRRSVIPRVRFETPEVTEIDDTSICLTWRKVDIPAFSAKEEPLLFMIERQELPNYEWVPVAVNVPDTSYKISGLKPYQDYNFRVRGIFPSGYTEASPYVPVYRRPIRLSVPVARTEVWEEEPYSARLRWQRAYIPRYYSASPLKYRIEMQEASGEHKSDWKPIASSVRGTDFTVNEISPRKDYNFRIRAEMENGDISDPTPPIQYYRSKVPMNRESFQLAEYKPIDIDTSAANRTYYQHLTKFVPPRLPIDKPDMVVINDETVELSWREARVPDAVRHTSNLSYTLEVRTPPSFEWRELASGLKILHHTIDDLHPKIDYIFRVRAWNDYGCSEPSLPVSLYRPCDYVDEYFVDDDDWEREWEEQYGCQEPEPEPDIDIEKVPPKLPMDTPRIMTQTPESLWFSWLPARIPAYAKQTPITYVIEMKEPPSTQWRRDVTGLVDCQYVREGLDPKKEYHIQIRAETEFGTSDPTLPLIIRTKDQTSGMKKSSSTDLKDDDLCIPIETSRLESITAGVPPRMPSTRPLCTNAYGDRLTLSWSACRVPSYVKSSSVSYTIEKREPPGHIWTVLVRDVSGTRYDITGLSPEQDYMFRVRAKNDFGVSEPTLPLSLFREKDDYVPPKARSRSGSRDSVPTLSWRRRSSSIDYTNVKVAEEEVPADVGIEYKIPSQPEYITTTFDTQYAVVGNKGKINLKVRGYPLPTVHWYHGEEKLAYGDQYNTFVTPQGGITLEIKNVGSDSVGQYKCYAENESGAAVKVVTLELADAPTVVEPLRDIQHVSNKPCTLTCRVDGMPEPSIKWMKDWRPLGDSSRIRMTYSARDVFSLEIDNALVTDSGVYSCTVENLAGKVTLTGRLDIDDPTGFEIPLRQAPIEDFYTVLEEIGRGKNGVVHRVIESTTGRQYAANFMFLRNKAQKHFFLSEFEALRAVHQMDGVLKLHDAFETDRGLIFVTEILTGPELLERMIAGGDWTEARVAGVVKQLLGTLREFENLGLLHLDIKPSNIRMSTPDSDDVKLINFGLARFLLPDDDILQNYGTVGYASPEQIINDVMTMRTDLWQIGVLTYVLLSGVAPFTGNSESDVLKNTLEGKWSFGENDFGNISKEAQDFISQLLKKEPIDRPSIEAVLAHPWLTTTTDSKLSVEKLKRFYNTEKLQRDATSVSTTPQLKSLTKILKCEVPHFTPAVDMDSGEIIFPDSDEYGDFLDEDSWYEWQLQFQDDPDSQELPVPSKDFHVHQARRTRTEKPLKKERDDKLEPDVGTSVMFRNKIQPLTFIVGEDVEFSCNVVSLGDVPVVTWYRDETLLSDAYRTEAYYSEETGVARLKVLNTKDYDAAVYKCVARNKDGRVSCQAPLLLGDKPSQPRRPVVTQTSGTEAFITWSGPASDGNSYIMGYRVDYRKSETGEEWTLGPYVNEEYCLISGLCPNTKYIFRVSCHNKYGTSPYSWASVEASTMDANAPAVVIAATLQPLLKFSTFTKQQLILPAESPRPSLTASPEAQLQEADPTESYNLGDTISKGAYGEYKSCTNKESNTQCVMKIVPCTKEKESEVTKEFQILRNLRQFNVITVLEGFISGELFYMVTEHLSGINIIQYLCLCKTYKEELVAHFVRQILDALQYLQNFGIAHLNLQPSSVIMATRRRPHIKLRDFTHAHIFDSQKVETVPPAGYPDFVAPEIIKKDPVNVNADVWSVAVLTFTMLSGGSPFAGQNLSETLTNILFDRYCVSDLYDAASKDSVKFISKLFKRLPKNRPSVNDCLSIRWLQQSESMIKLRSGRLFHSDKLREFSSQYVQRRADSAYMNIAGVSLDDIPKPEDEVDRAMDDALMFC